jgi:hypothetical protein
MLLTQSHKFVKIGYDIEGNMKATNIIVQVYYIVLYYIVSSSSFVLLEY